jgi:hypothetical protein
MRKPTALEIRKGGKTIRSVTALTLAVLSMAIAFTAHASEVGHFSPGVPNIRDFFVPEPGFYGIVYNYAYMSDRINDSNGDGIDRIAIGVPPLSATLDLPEAAESAANQGGRGRTNRRIDREAGVRTK